MYNFSSGLNSGARASFKTGLPICLAELEHQILLITVCQFLEPVIKMNVASYYSCPCLIIMVHFS